MSEDPRIDPDDVAKKLAMDQRQARLQAVARRVCGDDFAVAALLRALTGAA